MLGNAVVAMKFVNGFLDDAYMTFLQSPVACCSPTRAHAPGRGWFYVLGVLQNSNSISRC